MMQQSFFALPGHEAISISRVPENSALEFDFPAAILSEIARKESWRKEVHRPATATHKWWAKRLGSVFRAIIVAAVSDTSEQALSNYESKLNLSSLNILDPFAGSGTTAVEAAKLNAKPIAFDINPVATLVQRQAIQKWDWNKISKIYDSLERNIREEIDFYHRTEDGRTVLYYFWVAQAKCPSCSLTVNLFDSPIFSKHAYPAKHPEVHAVCPNCLQIKYFSDGFDTYECACGQSVTPNGSVRGANMTCSNGHTSRITATFDKAPLQWKMYAKMVIDTQSKKTYEPITKWDESLYDQCEHRFSEIKDDLILPVGRLEEGNNTNQALRWNFDSWDKFFNTRQLYSLGLIATHLRSFEPCPEREALIALFSGILEFNNMFTSFKGEGTGAVRHMFANHILNPQRRPIETHPWGHPKSSGSFSTLLKSRIERAFKYKNDPTDLVFENGKVARITGISHPLPRDIVSNWNDFLRNSNAAYIATRNAASTDIAPKSIDLIITDPPYMDNVHYAELADFFHSWLREIHPYSDYPGSETTRAEGEVQDSDPEAFGEAIRSVWTECSRTLKDDGILAFTYHQARLSGWVELLLALRDAGFVVTAIQPILGEMSTSVVKSAAKEPSHLDSVIVCRKSGHVPSYARKSEQEAVSDSVSRLLTLKEAGIPVSAGDVRSVIRGTLVAWHVFVASDDNISAEHVDDVTNEAVELFSRQI